MEVRRIRKLDGIHATALYGFVRTTKGKRGSLIDKAWSYELAGFVGHMLGPNPITLDQLVANCHSYSLQCGKELYTLEAIYKALVILLEYGLAEVRAL